MSVAADNPVTLSDPTGLHALSCPPEGCAPGSTGNPTSGCPSYQPGCPGYTGPGQTTGGNGNPTPTPSGSKGTASTGNGRGTNGGQEPSPAQIRQVILQLEYIYQMAQSDQGQYGGNATCTASRLSNLGACPYEVTAVQYGLLASGITWQEIALIYASFLLPVLAEGAGSLLTSLLGRAAAGATAADRVEQLQSALDPIAQNSRTSAVLNTQEGIDVLASGGRDLSPAQRALANEGDLLGRAPGAHAEVTALQAALKAGLTPSEMAVSRLICPACQAFIESTGGTITSGGTGATWP